MDAADIGRASGPTSAESIIRRATVCRIALSDGDQPYVVPVSFGYQHDTLYFHSAPSGRKLDILRKNNAVCVEFDVDCEIVRAETPCKWGIKYRSVIGFGRAYLVEGIEEKKKALDLIVAHYGGQPSDYPDTTLGKTTIVRVEIERMSAKTAGY
jgi:nitroimidazol reductase NimA-like FMN-containing flavoprotein (pyridoxamine 5'-phosphate oxidase superfamily)